MSRCLLPLIAALLVATTASASQRQQPSPDTPPQPQDPGTTFTVTVLATPLPGERVPVGVIPAPVQVATDRDIQRSEALDLSAFLERRLNGVYVNNVQNNPLQADLNYRGYTASPLLGTPQGLSIYMDGVRLNQPFGDVVSWDLIPRIAIASATLMPGSNPLFGLNTLGGSVSVQTKTGLDNGGTTIQGSYGSDVRRTIEIEHGGHRASQTLHWYVAGSIFGEQGWRADSPSDARQVFGKLGWQRQRVDLTVSAGHANASLTGNGMQDVALASRDWASIYTKPDTTDNHSTLVSASARLRPGPRTSVEAGGYYRDLRTATVNGDVNEESLDQALYEPSAAERAALLAAGYGPLPATRLDAANTPFPSLRCIANVLLHDAPAEKCNGLVNRTRTVQHSVGASTQMTHRARLGSRENLFTIGGAFDASDVDFGQSSELGFLNPDRGLTGLAAYADGVTGGQVDGEPYDTRVDLASGVTTMSVFAANVMPIGSRTHVTLSGRYNRTTVDNRDRVQPTIGRGSLTGHHSFGRFNPSAGVTIALPRSFTAYAAYSEGSRAPTAIELGCADPQAPCKLPNAMASDPPLAQVVARSWEMGVRAHTGIVRWNAGAFHTNNRHDILFVTSDQTGFGYFRNFGRTQRVGVELAASARAGRVTAGAGYTALAATFRSDELVNGASNSSNDAARAGRRGLDGSIAIEPGDRLPLVPRHVGKAFVDVDVNSRLGVDLDLLAIGAAFARGNENNAHQPDGVYYLGRGGADGYAIVNIGARYRLTPWLQVIGQITNLFDRQYATASQLGPTAFTTSGNFIARPLPAIDGEFPLHHTTFIAPGAPIRTWLGLRARF